MEQIEKKYYFTFFPRIGANGFGAGDGGDLERFYFDVRQM